MEFCAAASSSSSCDEYNRFAIKKDYSGGCENGNGNRKGKDTQQEK